MTHFCGCSHRKRSIERPNQTPAARASCHIRPWPRWSSYSPSSANNSMAAAVRASVRLSSRCVASVSRPNSLAACAARVATRGCSARSRPCFTPLASLNRRCANVVMSGNESSSSEAAAFPVRRFSAAAAAAAAAAQQGVLSCCGYG